MLLGVLTEVTLRNTIDVNNICLTCNFLLICLFFTISVLVLAEFLISDQQHQNHECFQCISAINVIKIAPYNLKRHRFQVGAFFEIQCRL